VQRPRAALGQVLTSLPATCTATVVSLTRVSVRAPTYAQDTEYSTLSTMMWQSGATLGESQRASSNGRAGNASSAGASTQGP